MEKRNFTKTLRWTLVVAAMLALAPLAPVSAANPAYGTCSRVQLPVALAVGRPASQTVAATYCQPNVWAPNQPHAVDVLSPGATYNQSYWDWPQQPSLYSYVDKTLQAGRATFDYDRMGTDGSSHPLSTLITTQSDAYVLHQIIHWLQRQAFTQVDSIGHSYGSILAIQEAGTYHDVSRLVVTGLIHVPNSGFAHAAAFLYPAYLDPHFAGLRLDPGYLTNIPGMRNVFYSSAADPSVIAYDNDHPDTVTLASLATGVTSLETLPGLNVSNSVTAPVLVVLGQEDGLFCDQPQIVSCSDNNAVQDFEAPYYTSATSLSAITIPDTGHDVALHPSADNSFSHINTWIGSH